MKIKFKYLVILSSIFISIFPSLVSANSGLIVIGKNIVSLDESGQNAIVAWNGEEEVIILSIGIKSSEAASVLQVLPLPSNPSKVEEDSFELFYRLIKIIAKKVNTMKRGRPGYGTLGGVEFTGIEITFYKKIGAHEITVVKVSDINQFINWIKNFLLSKGFDNPEISREFKNSVANYLNRGFKFFVFDIIETNKEKQSVKPLSYRFKSEFLYYPLEITATSHAGLSLSQVSIFFIAKGRINKEIIRNLKLEPGIGFDLYIKLRKSELKEINPELADLFKSDPLVMNAYYYDSLNRLNKDLVVYQKDIHTVTIFENIYQSISLLLVLQYLSQLWEEIVSDYTPIVGKVFLSIFLLSFVVGIPSSVFCIVIFFKKLFKKYKFVLFNWLGYLMVTIIIVLSLILNNTRWIVLFIILYTSIGFSMIIYLITRFYWKYIFSKR